MSRSWKKSRYTICKNRCRYSRERAFWSVLKIKELGGILNGSGMYWVRWAYWPPQVFAEKNRDEKSCFALCCITVLHVGTPRAWATRSWASRRGSTGKARPRSARVLRPSGHSERENERASSELELRRLSKTNNRQTCDETLQTYSGHHEHRRFMFTSSLFHLRI